MDTEIFENVDEYIRDLVGAEDEILKATYNSDQRSQYTTDQCVGKSGKISSGSGQSL